MAALCGRHLKVTAVFFLLLLNLEIWYDPCHLQLEIKWIV